MTDTPAKARDYSETLFLPKTDFPMRAGLPQKEPATLSAGTASAFTGVCVPPPRAGHALSVPRRRPASPTATCISGMRSTNLKDVVTRSQQMVGYKPTTCPAGTATACRSNGRSRRRTPAAKGAARFSDSARDRRLAAASAAPTPSTGSTCSARSSSASASSATGIIPTPPWISPPRRDRARDRKNRRRTARCLAARSR